MSEFTLSDGSVYYSLECWICHIGSADYMEEINLIPICVSCLKKKIEDDIRLNLGKGSQRIILKAIPQGKNKKGVKKNE